MKKLIPFIGGEWHGEAKEYSNNPPPYEIIGLPPNYLGNGQYDAHISHLVHERYERRQFEGNYYLVHEDWAKDFPANIDDLYETSNSRQMRQEVEQRKKNELANEVSFFRNNLLDIVIRKHESIDKKEILFVEYSEEERQIYIKFNKARKRLHNYKGEPPMHKERFKP